MLTMLTLMRLRVKYGSKIFATVICTQSLLMGLTRTTVLFLNSLLGCLLISTSFYPSEALVLCGIAVFKLIIEGGVSHYFFF